MTTASARPATLDTPAAKLAALRAELERRGLAGFVVPRSDEHQGEYVPPSAERLAWLTGFTGSAGVAVVLVDTAAVFVDGRYTLQAETQVDGALYQRRHVTKTPPGDWIAETLPRDGRLGYDPWLHTVEGVEKLAAAAERAGGVLVACDGNPLDAVWSDRPAPPAAPVRAHDMAYAGKSSDDKRAEIATVLKEAGHAAAVLTLPESIAWLLNIRGGDVPRTPLALAFAVVHDDGRVDLFIDPRKLPAGLAEDHLGPDVAVRPPDAFAATLDALGDCSVRVDPATASVWVRDRLVAAGARVEAAADPCLLPKAIKNAVELDGARAAHRRDGAALTRFLAWLAEEGPRGALSELAAAERLEALRREDNLLQDLSFDTISGAGPNGAVIHYRVTPESDRPIAPDMLYLVDSGGQYLDGTTDVTRTVAIGAPGDEMRRNFTRVLKGHIALATARFPAGTTGSQLDPLARRALWEAGLDYDHGTGHGVGSYLAVHEGPQRISKVPSSVPLRSGMIVSNEPGYYKAGAYGIRIENLVAVTALEAPAGAEHELLGFETLTLAPIDRALVEPALLNDDEAAWLDAYHARVLEQIGPRVDGDTRAWLEKATAPIAR